MLRFFDLLESDRIFKKICDRFPITKPCATINLLGFKTVMDYSKEIQKRLQIGTKYQVKVDVLQSHPKYTAMTKLDEQGKSVDPESLVKKLIPNAYPISNQVYVDNGWLCCSFYLDGDIPNIRIFTDQEIRDLALIIKKVRPEKVYVNKEIKEWDSDELASILAKDLHSKNNELEQKKIIGIYVTNHDVEKHGDYWKALLDKNGENQQMV